MKQLVENTIYEFFTTYNYCKRLILEAKHIVSTFNDVETYVVEKVKEFPINEPVYTGWNFFNNEDLCKKCVNEQIGTPIYVIVEYLGQSTFAYIDNRDFDNEKIMLHINHLNINDEDLLSKIHHEFVHAKSSYSNSIIDPLTNYNHQYDISNVTYYIDVKNKRYSAKEESGFVPYDLFNISYIGNAYNALYFISKTEQEARINQIYKYITSKYSNQDVLNRDELFKEVLYISLFDEFDELVSQCEKWQDNKHSYKLALCISYYMNEIGYMKYKLLSKENMIKYFNIIDGPSQEIDTYFNLCVNKCCEILYKSLVSYEKRVMSIINDAIGDVKNNTIK